MKFLVLALLGLANFAHADSFYEVRNGTRYFCTSEGGGVSKCFCEYKNATDDMVYLQKVSGTSFSNLEWIFTNGRVRNMQICQTMAQTDRRCFE